LVQGAGEGMRGAMEGEREIWACGWGYSKGKVKDG
tara:strand:+ start:121 stop:225 length:105 start_codon:yes stop_codon:yes gene_type:complete